jgi:hypothetical protein
VSALVQSLPNFCIKLGYTDGLQLLVTDLMKAGLSKDQITTAGREVTGKLLMG